MRYLGLDTGRGRGKKHLSFSVHRVIRTYTQSVGLKKPNSILLHNIPPNRALVKYKFGTLDLGLEAQICHVETMQQSMIKMIFNFYGEFLQQPFLKNRLV